MTEQQIIQWLTEGEGPLLEFKREFTTEVARDIVAFANGSGGVLLIGVDDDASLIGVSEEPIRIEERIMGLCAHTIRPTITPSVTSVSVQNVRVMGVTVPRGPQKPYTAQDVCYVRAGSTSRRAHPEELRRLALNGAYTEYEQTPVSGATEEDFDLVKLAAHIERRAPGAITVNGLAWADVAMNQGWARRENGEAVPTVSGLLLFGKNPQRLRPHWGVGAVRLSGTDLAAPMLDRADLEGNLVNLLEATADFVRRNMRVAGVFETEGDPFTRVDVPEYPMAAVREAVVNALVHRDYSRPGRIAVRLFEDRLEVWNPGGLLPELSLEDLVQTGGQSVARNPILARTLREWGKMEEIGRGLLRIRRELHQLGSEEPQFESETEWFQVTLPSRHRGLVRSG
jgi:predicted HTH transcriptional regulator